MSADPSLQSERRDSTALSDAGGQPGPLPAELARRKRDLLTRSTPSTTTGIADAVVIKDDDLFFLAGPDGMVPLDERHGLGLYHRDCRFLDGYALALGGRAPQALLATAARGCTAVLQLTNAEIPADAGGPMAKEAVGLRWERTVDGRLLVLQEHLAFRNFGRGAVELPVSIAFRASFDDVFAIRGLLDARFGELEEPSWHSEDELRFRYRGGDGIDRHLIVRFGTAPTERRNGTAGWVLQVEPGVETNLLLSLAVVQTARSTARRGRARPPTPGEISRHLRGDPGPAFADGPRVQTEEMVLENALDRALRDLRALETKVDGYTFFAAGVPWFGTLFGRDALITSLQVLAFDSDVAAQTLRLLARYQGREVDEWRDEQPGKILHELRVGELAQLCEIPHTPYYGSVDATPLFLVLLARHAAWSGTLDLFRELRDNVELALRWIDEYGDLDGDGFVEYQSPIDGCGLVNQGWKDSGDAIVDHNGDLAEPPIALVEVQGYVYAAKREVAALFRLAGEEDRAARLEREAEILRQRLEGAFWLEREGVYALALHGSRRRPAEVVSSNAGHALWSGIASPERAKRVVDTLLSEPMWSGWGIRTLSREAKAYNPIGYHLGTVWPHDNAILAAGFHRYGHAAAAERVFTALLEAAMHQQHYQLPELFAGYDRAEYGVPMHYPVACHPQAWAAGSVPYMLQSLLGLAPDAFARRLHVVRPVLPSFVEDLELRNLRVGDSVVDLAFERGPRGIAVHVTRVEGDLRVLVEP